MQFSLDFHNLHEMPTKHIALWRHRKKKKKEFFPFNLIPPASLSLGNVHLLLGAIPGRVCMARSPVLTVTEPC